MTKKQAMKLQPGHAVKIKGKPDRSDPGHTDRDGFYTVLYIQYGKNGKGTSVLLSDGKYYGCAELTEPEGMQCRSVEEILAQIRPAPGEKTMRYPRLADAEWNALFRHMYAWCAMESIKRHTPIDKFDYVDEQGLEGCLWLIRSSCCFLCAHNEIKSSGLCVSCMMDWGMQTYENSTEPSVNSCSSPGALYRQFRDGPADGNLKKHAQTCMNLASMPKKPAWQHFSLFETVNSAGAGSTGKTAP